MYRPPLAHLPLPRCQAGSCWTVFPCLIACFMFMVLINIIIKQLASQCQVMECWCGRTHTSDIDNSDGLYVWLAARCSQTHKEPLAITVTTSFIDGYVDGASQMRKVANVLVTGSWSWAWSLKYDTVISISIQTWSHHFIACYCESQWLSRVTM